MITIRAFDFPLSQAIAHAQDCIGDGDASCVLAMIGNVSGPSFRPLGASMFIMQDGTCFGGLSSGCIDGDVAQHAAHVLKDKVPRKLRYGQGSPFMDIQLPCGGTLDIFLVPIRDIGQLRAVSQSITERQVVTLSIDMELGGVSIVPHSADDQSAQDQNIQLHILPDARFVVLGAGAEARAFAGMAASAGYDTALLSPDTDTLAAGLRAIPDLRTRHITQAAIPSDIAIDAHTAVILFFHSHDWEAGILLDVLKSQAFYIGAQGSLRTANTRIEILRAAGVGDADLARIKGPIGLIRSTRDPRTLAVSVLAEVLSFNATQGQI
ncbi:XdhC family protein [Pacificibacter marinus]|uniref:XdhC and CoxI family protein n=1 Tax=Pacificibacter marinus TaxID=658057 RepID=A0A1Y5RXQ1_9RHOB|nr:XdhC family protein [Pacificibacter marinus]SEK40051.1 xanthine dehydrogenase accessory factor [Pacificibacter marinus]SLN25362.1 XdhC and CoxI family protein [Pacificibacter marinus]